VRGGGGIQNEGPKRGVAMGKKYHSAEAVKKKTRDGTREAPWRGSAQAVL